MANAQIAVHAGERCPPTTERSAPYLYARERTLCLDDIIPLLKDPTLRRIGRRARDIEVYILKVTTRANRGMRTPPLALGDCLYLDLRDYRALREGTSLPRVGDAVRSLLERRRARSGGHCASRD